MRLLAEALPYAILPTPGGLAISEHGAVVAGIGIGGPDPNVCEQIASWVLG